VVVPNSEAILSFKSEKAFETWLRANHARKSEIYVRIYKKDTNVPTVTYAQALDVALCWGWIDGIRKAYDDASFLQRFTPRKANSRWSQINREHVARLCAAGRMTPVGQKHIDAAKADGRWDAAYASPSKLEVPPDLAAAIQAEPKAFETFQRLNRQNVYALAYRTIHIKTPAVRERRIREYVQMLKRGESIHPNGQSRSQQSQGRVTGEKKRAKRATPKATTKNAGR
jgi:uncharacterized protein YdeI (YjbR/CyaY-like superfamily)